MADSYTMGRQLKRTSLGDDSQAKWAKRPSMTMVNSLTGISVNVQRVMHRTTDKKPAVKIAAKVPVVAKGSSRVGGSAMKGWLRCR